MPQHGPARENKHQKPEEKSKPNATSPLPTASTPQTFWAHRPGMDRRARWESPKSQTAMEEPPQTKRGGQRQTRRGPRTAPEGPRTARENFNDAETGAQEVPTRPPTPARLPRKTSDSLRECTKRPDKTFVFSLQNSSFPCSGEYPSPYPLPRAGEGGGQMCQRVLFRSRWLQ